MIPKNRGKKFPGKKPAHTKGKEVGALDRCKTCGRQYNVVQTMTYSAYGYCSWECLMNHTKNSGGQNKVQRRLNGHRNTAGHRSRQG